MSILKGIATTAAVVSCVLIGRNKSPNVWAEDFLSVRTNLNENQKIREKLKDAIAKSKTTCMIKMYEDGLPGLFIAVSLNGKTVWRQGFGYSDVENKIVAHPDAVLRVASISKAFTAALTAKMLEDGKINLEDPISKYLPDYPHPEITIQQLLTHTSGIRHYGKKGSDKKEFDLKEYYIKEKFKSVTEALELFKNDDLIGKPGKDFLYTTHGYTLLSAILEQAEKKYISSLQKKGGNDDSDKKSGDESEVKFPVMMKKLFIDMGLNNTYLDEHDVIICNRARYYIRDDNHKLKNAPYVDNSYKWAGGGFLSTVGDLVKFGNALLYSFQKKTDSTVKNVDYKPSPFSSIGVIDDDDKTRNLKKPGFLKSETMHRLWSGFIKTNPNKSSRSHVMYGLGWQILPEDPDSSAFCRNDRFSVWHTGGAVGASSVLYVLPHTTEEGDLPKGVVVAIMTNIQEISLTRLAQEVATNFEYLGQDDSNRFIGKVFHC